MCQKCNGRGYIHEQLSYGTRIKPCECNIKTDTQPPSKRIGQVKTSTRIISH